MEEVDEAERKPPNAASQNAEWSLGGGALFGSFSPDEWDAVRESGSAMPERGRGQNVGVHGHFMCCDVASGGVMTAKISARSTYLVTTTHDWIFEVKRRELTVLTIAMRRPLMGSRSELFGNSGMMNLYAIV